MKKKTGSVKALAMMIPQVCGRLSRSLHPGDFLALLRSVRFLLVSNDHLEFRFGDACVSPVGSKAIARQSARETRECPGHECRPPSPSKVNPQNNEWCDGTANRRTAIEQRSRKRALASSETILRRLWSRRASSRIHPLPTESETRQNCENHSPAKSAWKRLNTK